MKVLIWGAGAIGGTIGAFLVRAGHDVVLVDRVEDHIDTVNRDGLTITGPLAEFTVRPRAFTPDTITGRYDTILLCVKAQHTEIATRELEPHLSDDGCVVSVQNGLNEPTIARLVGAERTVGAFVNFGADYLEPGKILYGGRGAVVIGEIDGQITPRIKALHRLMLDFDDAAILTTNIFGYLWGKLAYGAQLFATALTNESIADVLAMPAYHDLFIDLAREILGIAQQHGVEPEGFNGFNPHAFVPGVERSVSEASLAEMVAFNRKSAKTHSGIWRDLAVRKRPTEVSILLPIVDEAHRQGLAAPLTTRLIDLVQRIERGELEQDLSTLDQLKAVADEY